MSIRKTHEELRDSVRKHFNEIASDYDSYKKRSEYYYCQLKLLLKELTANYDDISIIEIGCGTGSLLAELSPTKGIGVDISENMIRIAATRWENRPELTFVVGEAETLQISGGWNVVLMCDVIEHLYNPEAAIRRISEISASGTRLIITWANNLWEPILHLLERLKLKMPEGDHNWESCHAVKKMLETCGFEILTEGTRCIIPVRWPVVDTLNRNFYTVPIIKKLGLIRFIEARKHI